MLISADVGGTKVVLGCKSSNRETPWHHLAIYASSDFPTFSSLFAHHIAEQNIKPTALKIGIAGPVFDNECTATNLPWTVNGAALAKEFDLSEVVLANDLVAGAYGLSQLGMDDLITINQGEATIGNRALIAAGTGLGEAILYWNGSEHKPFATEGGHTNFGPNTDEEVELLRFLLKRHKRVSWERVVSGRMGFANIYRFLSSIAQDSATHSIDPKTEDSCYGPLITQAAIGGCPLARACVKTFLTLYGSEASNLALKSMSVNGLYVGGGIVHHLRPWLESTDWFWQGFRNKGRFTGLLEKMPVFVVKDRHLALSGATLLP